MENVRFAIRRLKGRHILWYDLLRVSLTKSGFQRIPKLYFDFVRQKM